MEKEFVPYEQALALKELGFDEPCFIYYGEKNILRIYTIDVRDLITNSELAPQYNTCPTFSQAFRWFREKYGYFQLFDYQHGDSKINRGFFFNIVNIDNEDFFFPEDFENQIYKTYEEVELACLKKLIEIIKDGKK